MVNLEQSPNVGSGDPFGFSPHKIAALKHYKNALTFALSEDRMSVHKAEKTSIFYILNDVFLSSESLFLCLKGLKYRRF